MFEMFNCRVGGLLMRLSEAVKVRASRRTYRPIPLSGKDKTALEAITVKSPWVPQAHGTGAAAANS
jgi:hypothetical protein